MSSFEIETYELPTHWACYFINADPSCLDDADIAEADGWWEETFPCQSVSCVDVKEDGHFCKYHDADRWCLAGEVATFTFLIHKEG
ncbi:hypothetical protein KQ304_04330 [Synechococcus sp. CS-1329]|uniref:DUF6926 domain-containing protein n=1 Tax=Synechococcus sp. CS-1329 TaxID=2847975 RepID=UPI00223B6CF8|nr:hypothetical protein [Synechococcus sp. CS-1329]MCT0218233.1 hypothetical protein [Synechococcus sp. CS-1329]